MFSIGFSVLNHFIKGHSSRQLSCCIFFVSYTSERESQQVYSSCFFGLNSSELIFLYFVEELPSLLDLRLRSVAIVFAMMHSTDCSISLGVHKPYGRVSMNYSGITCARHIDAFTIQHEGQLFA